MCAADAMLTDGPTDLFIDGIFCTNWAMVNFYTGQFFYVKLVALHSTSVSHSLDQSVGPSFELA